MKVTPHWDTDKIMGGRFQQGRNYRNWRPTGTKDWLFIYTFSGSGEYKNAKGESYHSVAGDCTLYEPGAWHSYQTEHTAGEWGLLWAHFHPYPHWRAWLDWPLKWKGLRFFSVSKLSVRKKIESAMVETVDHARTGLPLSGDLGLNSFERTLLAIERERLGHPLGNLDARILQAVQYLAQHFKEPFSVSGLAKKCGLSDSRFAHLFRSQTGVTPQSMWEEHRMRHASRMLLSTGLNVTEVAAEAGYENPFYFSHRFHLFFGLSPAAYRKRNESRRIEEGLSP